MKIYNKKTFAFGIFAVALGLLNLGTSLWTKFDVESVVIILFLFFFGGGSILRSVSRKFSKEDKLEELDERNQLIELKSGRKAFRLTQLIIFVSMLAFLVLGKVLDLGFLISIGVGLAFAFSISMFTELFTYFYCEKHN